MHNTLTLMNDPSLSAVVLPVIRSNPIDIKVGLEPVFGRDEKSSSCNSHPFTKGGTI